MPVVKMVNQKRKGVKPQIETLIYQAKRILVANPKDKAHDLTHHETVWRNCQMIVEGESLTVNMDALYLAAFWHDVIIDGKKEVSKDEVEAVCRHLESSLKELNIDDEFVELTVEIVKHHEFLDIPNCVEGMVLQDADKLDVLSTERFINAHQDYKTGVMPRDVLKSYIHKGLTWLPLILSSFYFDTSKEVGKERINRMLKDPKYTKIAQEMGEDVLFVETKRLLRSGDGFPEAKRIQEKTNATKKRLLG